MSPEQMRSSRGVDHRTDLWSVGVILYRALTGRLPFPGDIGEVIRGYGDGAPAPSTVVPDLPPALDAFFSQALACDVDKRFLSVGELLEAFRSATPELHTVAMPASLSMRRPPDTRGRR
jgi:serine/threonine-protein kinase